MPRSMSARRPNLSVTVLAAFSILASIHPAHAADSGEGLDEAVDLYVSEPVVPYVLDVDLRRLPSAPDWQPGDPIEVVPEGFVADYGIEPDPSWADPVRQRDTEASDYSTTVQVGFQAFAFTGARPPDVVGDVGLDHYIGMVNATRVAIWDKQGTLLVGPITLNTLWTGNPSSPCSDGDGDPIVRYDELADRWLLTEFDLTGNTFCIYVSQGPDPVTSGWFVYDFSAPDFPDYPKYGVWPDAYYVSSFESPFLGIYAFDRISMLAGAPATFQRFTIPQLNGTSSRVTRILPADAEGGAPPAGAPNIYARTVDDTQDSSNPFDRIELWEFDVDFVTPANSTFVQVDNLIPAAFTLLPCSPGIRDCISQPGTSVKIDALFNRPLRRLQYRNFGTYESMVVNQVVDAGGGVAGKRWYEMRRDIIAEGTGSGWSIYQQGTFAPDAAGRFMGSVAMNVAGDIALGYSISDATSIFPGIRATARRASDPLGQMTMEELTIVEGIGAQTSSQRWGDYTSMDVDPTDGRTFWYTNQIIEANGQWSTHVGSFRIDLVFDDDFESGDLSNWSGTSP